MAWMCGCGTPIWEVIIHHPIRSERNSMSAKRFSVYCQNWTPFLFLREIRANSNPMNCLGGWRKRQLCCKNITRMPKYGFHPRCSNPLPNGTENFISMSTGNTIGLEVLSVSYTHLRAHETGRNLVC